MNQLIGTWRLLALEQRSEDQNKNNQTEPEFPMGKNCQGILMYDQHGNMNAQLMAEDRKSFASQDIFGGSVEEIRSAINTYVAYFGKYEIDPDSQTVRHIVQGSLFPNWLGSIQERSYAFRGDLLELSTPPIKVSGQVVRVVLLWKRVTAD